MKNKIAYIKSVLSNDEISTNKELVRLFVKEIHITKRQAITLVGMRNKYLNVL